MMRAEIILLAAILAATPTQAQQTTDELTPTEWMLVLGAPPSVAVAPTMYATLTECHMAADAVRDASIFRAVCIPAHFNPEQIADVAKAADAATAKQNELNKSDEAAKQKAAEQIARERPALEAERREILADRNKLNQKKYADRVLEIDNLLRSIQ